MEVKEQINKRLNALAKSSFRSRFHLSIADKDLIAKKGRGVIRKHGEELSKHVSRTLPLSQIAPG